VYLALRAARAAILAALGCVALVTVLPPLFGWQPTIVISGSMAPAIRTGDVVLTAPLRPSDAAALPVGAVVLATDPGRAHDLLMHRVVAHNADGTLTTKGDANPLADTTPMPATNLKGVGRIRVPLIGIPVLRARKGDWLPALAVVVVTLALAGLPFSSDRGKLSVR
jgi:signal peptidase